MLIPLLDFSFFWLFIFSSLFFRYFLELVVFDFFDDAIDGKNKVEKEGEEYNGL